MAVNGCDTILHSSSLFIIIYSVNIKPPRQHFGLSLCLGLAITDRKIDRQIEVVILTLITHFLIKIIYLTFIFSSIYISKWTQAALIFSFPYVWV
jgi:hypothetical protein